MKVELSPNEENVQLSTLNFQPILNHKSLMGVLKSNDFNIEQACLSYRTAGRD